jgi:glycosyltransferase involved in cell wall biosynthesis/GT2 family glycosyltransferase
MERLSIVVLSWNGKELLRRFLPSVIKAAECRPGSELIVVDDGSRDGTSALLAQRFPGAKLVRLEKNSGFAAAALAGIRASNNRVVVLLNNDVEPQPDFLDHLEEYFRRPDTFAVRIRSRVIDEKGSESRESWVGGGFRLGFFYGTYDPAACGGLQLSFTAGGGAMALDRDKFLELGGFDRLYFPFYYEDVDLCYRAWKRGWKIYYEPRSILSHYHHSTIGRSYSPGYIAFIGERNRYLVVWRNISDPALLLRHILFTVLRLLRNLLLGRILLCFAYVAALARLPVVWLRLRRDQKEAKVSDREIFALFSANNVRPARVLYIDEWADVHGGGQIYLLNLINNLDKTQFVPLVVLPAEGSLSRSLRDAGCKVRIVPLRSFKNPLTLLVFPVVLSRLISLVREERVALVHSNGGGRGTVYAGLTARLSGVPMVWHAHVTYKSPFDRFLFAITDRIIAVNDAVKERFSGYGKSNKVTAVVNGVDLRRYVPAGDTQPAGRQVVVGTAGILHPVKGCEAFLRAAAIVKKDLGAAARFVIIGEDKGTGYRSQLERLSVELGLQELVSFPGWRDDMPAALAGMDIFVLPSQWDHMPLVVLEAMACAKPVVASDVGGVPGMVEDNVTGILVPPGDHQRLAEAVLGLIRDPAAARQMGLAGRQRVEKLFDMALNARKVEGLYVELLSRRIAVCPA